MDLSNRRIVMARRGDHHFLFVLISTGRLLRYHREHRQVRINWALP